jgi:nitrite reductase (NADH) small subunit
MKAREETMVARSAAVTSSTGHTPAVDEARWEDVCALDAIVPGTGAAALVAGEQIAIVKTRSGDVRAISNFDPFSRAFVLARGIVGDRDGRPKIASPIYKQSFDLETGVCLDDPKVKLPVYAVRIAAGRIHIDLAARKGS